MPIVKFQHLKKSLRTDKKIRSAVWLIHGEEFLCAKALETILSSFLPTPADRMNYEPLGGSDDQVLLALEKVNTYTFLPGCKIVALLGSRVFDSKKKTPDLLDKARSAHAEDNLKGAGRFFMRFLGVQGLSLDDITEKDRQRLLKTSADGDDQWLDPVINYCRDKGLEVPRSTDKSQMLESAAARGFPENHHLIITTDIVDRRRRLYKVIAENGMVIDCSVATGSRQAEKAAQEAVLKERMAAILKKFNKQMDTVAFRALYEKTGFNLRIFCASLEKVVNYIGDRHRIQLADVEKTLIRTRQDPVFELTSAVAERNLQAGLFFLKSMITGALHPLQIIAALANQIRKLIVAREFIESSHGRVWQPRISYAQFRQSVMPAIIAYDDELRAMLSGWDDVLTANMRNNEDAGARPQKKKGKKKKSPASQLVLAPNPNNPYPVLKTLENANRFTSAELIRALEKIYASDLQLKTGVKNPKVALDNLIAEICRRQQNEKEVR